jgi:hypothetical protein
MQLVQIGEIRQKTILDLIQEMAAKQLQEIEQLKASARSRAAGKSARRTSVRCSSAKRRR